MSDSEYKVVSAIEGDMEGVSLEGKKIADIVGKWTARGWDVVSINEVQFAEDEEGWFRQFKITLRRPR